ncbi:MAG: OmpA family protein [Haliscomenobacter sp.]|uniref:OmpA family protein n=1 Tax=Haliscomenobacter sp. TaxID=2717303 RepID=UPI0029BF8E1A|nr:OmpA family protein [Haliscomenobacter sp.]MDX2069124.1 OmpA family protein [Haliscomenobacter sp.]
MKNNHFTKLFFIPLLFILMCIHYAHAQQDTLLLKIYFAEGKYNLTASAKAQLQSFATQHKTQQNISIVGRGDRKGSDALNDSLSLKRALTVKSFLIANQFPRENIHAIIGYGRRNPIEPYTDSLNRVVWITVSAGEAPTASGSKVYSYRDSLVLVSAPYPAKFLNQHPAPQAGDTLLIETRSQQIGDTLRSTRVIYLAIGDDAPSKPGITAISMHDSLILLLPPYPPTYLVGNKKPYRGDTLHIDTTMLQVNTTLYILRKIYLADETLQTTFPLGAKEIPEKTKAAELARAFMDTLQSSTAGQAIIIRGLGFEFGYHVMPKSDLPALQAVSSALKSMPRLKLEIRGHVCCGDFGQDVFDKQSGQYDLSTNRAKEVYEYLLTEGIDQSRISFSGQGMKEPIVFPEKGKNDQYRNRRIEFVIVEK